ncbi:MAG: protein SCO1/2 [Candidatus Binatia bacterium]
MFPTVTGTIAKRTAKALAAVSLMAMLVVGLVAGPSFVTLASASLPVITPGARADQAPVELKGVDLAQNLGDQLPLDLEFTDSTGKQVRLGDLFGERPVVLAMVYYECPMLCTLVLNGLTKTMRTMTFSAGEQFDVIAVSIDPGETSELAANKKKVYQDSYGRPGTEDGWHFLVGNEASIAELAEAVGFSFQYIPETGDYAHAAALTVATPSGLIARYFYGIEFAPRDLRLGFIEAANGKIGNAIDKLLLYCYRYDPKSGSYSAYAMAMVRVGGVITLLALVGFITVSRLAERRSARKS